MRLLRWLCVAVVALSLAPAFGQNQTVTVGSVSEQEVFAEGTSEVGFTLEVAPDWHLYAPGDHDFVATTVKHAKGPFEVVGVRFGAKIHEIEFFGERIPTFDGAVGVRLTVKPSGLSPGAREILVVKVNYQACMGDECTFPTDVVVTLPLVVKAGSGAASSAAVAPVSQGENSTATTQPASESGSDSLLYEMLFALLAGLGVTLTPCVYPLIPVTLTYFQREAGSRAGTIAQVCAYGFGICVMYTTLGVVMASLGQDLGTILGSPFVSWTFVGLFFALALSMFGYFELALPSSVTTKLQSGGRRGGVFGALILGLTLGLVAAPCVGPVAGGLMVVVATSGDIWFGIATFGSFGLGLALPFMALGLFSTNMRALPRAGAWMESIKHFFGWALLAFCIYFANVAIADERVLLVLIGLWVFFAGISSYLAGKERLMRADEGSALGTAQFGGGVLAALFGAYLLVGPVVLPKDGKVLLRPQELFATAIEWEDGNGRHDVLLAEAKAQGKPVFLDFTAKWCIPCQKIELTSFRDDRIVKELKRFVCVKIDVTKDEHAQKLKTDRYKSFNVPYMAFYDSAGNYLRDLDVRKKPTTEELLKTLKEIH